VNVKTYGEIAGTLVSNMYSRKRRDPGPIIEGQSEEENRSFYRAGWFDEKAHAEPPPRMFKPIALLF
jgi:hypothetical protein